MSQDPKNYKIVRTFLEKKSVLNIVGQANDSGEQQTAEIDLDSFIGNVNGALSLGGTNFSEKARKVTLVNDGKIIDAEIPDDNGDFSTSSMSLQRQINTLDGKLALLFAIGLPHSQVHADADTVKEADAILTKQVETGDGTPDVKKMMTLKTDQDFDMDNTNKDWVKKNLGPQGQIGTVIQVATFGVQTVAVVGGTLKAGANRGICSVM